MPFYHKAGALFLRILHPYVQIHGLGFVGHEKTMISLTRNDYEPDICFWSREKSAKFKPGQTRFPAPDFIAEILSPCNKRERPDNQMGRLRRSRVREYWIIDTDNKTVEQYVSDNDTYHLQAKTDSGMIKSHAIKGFDIPVVVLFDEEENLSVRRKILSISHITHAVP